MLDSRTLKSPAKPPSAANHQSPQPRAAVRPSPHPPAAVRRHPPDRAWCVHRLMWVKDLLLGFGCILRGRRATCWPSTVSIYLKSCSSRMIHTTTKFQNHMTASTWNHLDRGSVSLMFTRRQWSQTTTPQS